MSDQPPSRELRGLSRAVDDLFAGREAESVELPPPLGAPRPEVEGLTDAGIEEVAWVADPARRPRPAEATPPSIETTPPSVEAVPPTVEATPHSAEATPPSAEPAEEHGEGTALRRALAAFVAGSEAERPALATAVRREVERLKDARDASALADAVERLVKARADDRGAIALASEMVSPGVAAVFTGRLREASRDEARREELIAVIAHLGDEMVRAVADALTMTDDRSERRALFDALVALAPGHRDIVLELLDDPRWFVVRNAVQVLGETADADDLAHLTAPLAHDHPKVRREVLVALARIGGDDATALMMGKVADPSAEVRSAAAMALGEVGHERALRPLVDQLEIEGDLEVGVEIIRALGALGDPGAVPALEKQAVASFFSRRPSEIRVAAFRALGSIGTPHARKLIEAATDDRDPEVRGVSRFLSRQLSSPASDSPQSDPGSL